MPPKLRPLDKFQFMIGASLFAFGLGGAFFGADDHTAALLGGMLIMALALASQGEEG